MFYLYSGVFSYVCAIDAKLKYKPSVMVALQQMSVPVLVDMHAKDDKTTAE